MDYFLGDRRERLRWLFVTLTCLWASLVAYDYWTEQGLANAFFVLLGGSVFLVALVAVPELLRAYASRSE